MALLKPLLTFLAIFLMFLFFVNLTEQQIVRDLANGLSYANFGKHEKSRLNAGQLENTTAQSPSQCCAKCLPNTSCFSVNFGGIGRNECQLLSTNKFKSSNLMTIDETFQHFSVVVSKIFVKRFTLLYSFFLIRISLQNIRINPRLTVWKEYNFVCWKCVTWYKTIVCF